MPKSVFDEEIKLMQQWKKEPPHIRRAFLEFRRLWKAKGPVEFAHEVLKIDPNTGGPLYISSDQEEFLLDVWRRNVRLVIIIAGRGAGKTFILAVYIMWRIFTHESWGIACMGGSREQSDKIHSYIAGWINYNETLQRFCMKCTLGEVKSFANSYASFHACSATSVRGPHTHELIIDEQAAGEEKGKTKYIKAAIWEVSTSPDIHIIKSSTAHYIHGDFLKTWTDADKIGYKRYQWAIAKHISGEIDPYKIYEDSNPKNWKSNVPWILDRNIRILRDGRSNDEWLVEALGGISRSSGLVFNPLDIDFCICDYCPRELGTECRPYEEGECPLLHTTLESMGVPDSEIHHLSVKEILMRFIKVRIEGIDWGKVSPCAYTAIGKFRTVAFVLQSEEITGAPDREKVYEGEKIARKWNCDIIRPDPREWSFNNLLGEKGFSIHELFAIEGGKEKNQYLFTLKRFVERHNLKIPCAFEDLIRSMRNLTFDESGKIRKEDDHSFDSLLYAISYYGELDEGARWADIIHGIRGREKKKVDVIDMFGGQKRKEKEKREKVEKDKNVKKKKRDDTWEGFDLWGSK